MVYNSKKRCGDTLHSELCSSCKLRDACTVEDKQLKQWLLCGMGCLSWRPEKPVENAGFQC